MNRDDAAEPSRLFGCVGMFKVSTLWVAVMTKINDFACNRQVHVFYVDLFILCDIAVERPMFDRCFMGRPP